MAMKYIRYREYGVIMFEKHINHSDIAELTKNPHDVLVSAGTAAIWSVNDELEVQASGGSKTLNLPSLSDDADLIKRRLSLY